MGKLVKGLVKFTVAAAAVGGICYAFKDQIKESKVYKEHNMDEKLKKVTTAIKEKFPKTNEEDIVDEDEIFFEDSEPGERDYVTLEQEGEAATETGSDTAEADEAQS